MKMKYCKKIKGRKTCTANAEESAGEIGNHIDALYKQHK